MDRPKTIQTKLLKRASTALAVAALALVAACGTMSPAQQLTESSFDTIKPGMSSDQVLAQLGRPSWVFGAGWQDHYHVWNYRWAGADCIWFQISINDTDQRVKDAAMAPDPKCDGPHPRD